MRHTRAKCTHSHHKRKEGRKKEVDLRIAKLRDTALGRARYSLPPSGAQPPRVHLAHVAHADQSDALAGLHVDCGTRGFAWCRRGVSPLLVEKKDVARSRS
jgi:hypothetical protein